ncbi:type I restriction enzyme endonuclease domain-containing protein [Acidithiobacillus thiooxidans]|uniref:Type I restriction enzyme HindI endonuclease subunit-like C-terminal domain-containing protein n=1 Tax=Acidithiobacillus thiooxidans TaxID=930 RepID=A0A1C2IQE4_ACITH|nr:type I restriction enzyme endonuclease domain-containing protein [Acidithiobacillus thiooxidans]OCX75561.1 hypothetical protein A6M23_02095 [Acidithiobacillus thiooxidans]OCX78212.1 hypothetical protein A6P08_20060 [Acidithiobacillus thiooxidans]
MRGPVPTALPAQGKPRDPILLRASLVAGLPLTIRQLVDQSIASERVADLYAVAGIDRPDIYHLSEQFLDQLTQPPEKNLP